MTTVVNSEPMAKPGTLCRRVGDNMKIGVGYNFGHFSDDLTDLTYDDHGIFVNAVGKF